jgi:hypothetical protein
MKARYLLALLPLALASCDQRTPEQQAEQAAGRPMTLATPVHVGTSGQFEVYRVDVPRTSTIGDPVRLWVVPGATTRWTCGKHCVRTVSSPGGETIPDITPEVLAALQKLTSEERNLLGLPDPNDPRVSGLARLTPEERAALGLNRR